MRYLKTACIVCLFVLLTLGAYSLAFLIPDSIPALAFWRIFIPTMVFGMAFLAILNRWY
jgi:Ca2+/Na+ antiporter